MEYCKIQVATRGITNITDNSNIERQSTMIQDSQLTGLERAVLPKNIHEVSVMNSLEGVDKRFINNDFGMIENKSSTEACKPEGFKIRYWDGR